MSLPSRQPCKMGIECGSAGVPERLRPCGDRETKLSETVRMRPGDVVEVRPAAEILATLDDDACTGALPFMPEMLRFVGGRYTVAAVARKVCDTTRDGTGNRLLHDTVLLDDLRCNGSAHGGCQAGCRLLWRGAWLRRISPQADAVSDGGAPELEARARAGTKRLREIEGKTVETFRCQATELVAASEPFAPGERGSKYLREVQCGNVGVGRFLRVCTRALSRKLAGSVGLGAEVALRSAGPPAPIGPLDLRPGELVQVKSKREIARTVDENGSSRGLSFDWEMLPHCGRTYRVQDRVERIIDENTGAMIQLKSDCLILEGVACSGDWSAGRWFCPRGIYPYWREDWLRRAGEPAVEESVVTHSSVGPPGSEPGAASPPD
jgi:hypothetical protein